MIINYNEVTTEQVIVFPEYVVSEQPVEVTGETIILGGSSTAGSMSITATADQREGNP